MPVAIFQKAVWEATKQVPRGKVTTYAAIAKFIGRPRAARAVGNALNKNPYSPKVPCHRVVKSNGSLGGFSGGARKKKQFLEREGVKIRNNKVIDFGEKILNII